MKASSAGCSWASAWPATAPASTCRRWRRSSSTATGRTSPPALGEVTRKQWQCQLEASQAITHAALEDQAALAAGVSEAVSGWLRNASAAASGGLADSPLTRMWSSYCDQMTSACSAMREASQFGARHGD
ncbi:hypothetical protein ACOTDL_05415 [Achromobacter xylosoxidans]